MVLDVDESLGFADEIVGGVHDGSLSREILDGDSPLGLASDDLVPLGGKKGGFCMVYV